MPLKLANSITYRDMVCRASIIGAVLGLSGEEEFMACMFTQYAPGSAMSLKHGYLYTKGPSTHGPNKNNFTEVRRSELWVEGGGKACLGTPAHKRLLDSFLSHG